MRELEAKIIDIDKKEERPKDRALGDKRYNRNWGRVDTVHRNQLEPI